MTTNQRMKELAEQAEEYVQTVVKRKKGWSDESIIRVRREKFVELIVQECCIEIAEEAAKHSHYGMGVLAVSSNSIARIKQHFGIQ